MAENFTTIKVPNNLYQKLKKLSDEKGYSIGEAINSLEKVVLKNFPHSTAADLIKCDACRKSVIYQLQNYGYWPKPEIKEVTKIVEVPAGKIEIDKGPIKHLSYEIKPKHLV